MKKILITGASGMVGSNITNHRLAQDYHLLSPASKDLNLLNLSVTKKYLEINKPDVIIHCAGLVGGIKANISNPYGFLYENMSIGFNLIEAARQSNIINLINLGSSCMYPRNATNPLVENKILTGELEPTNEGYALAKISVAKLCAATRKNGLNYVTLIPCNLYGEWDKFDKDKAHLIPAAINKVDSAKRNNFKKIDVWGSGLARREFMFAEDLADFIYFSLDKLDKLPDMMNVGTGCDYSVCEYYNFIKEVIGTDKDLQFDISKPEGMKQKLVDISWQKHFSWSPKTNIRHGIEKTYLHYLKMNYRT